MRRLLLLFLILAVPSVFGAIPAQERAALIAVYNGLDGPNWKSRANWLGAPGTECTWDHVTCDSSSSTVTELDVSWINARGVLPKQIGDLSNLEVLRANGSGITGALPAEIGRLSKLRILNFDGFYDNYGDAGNEISGPLPRELGQLTNLRELNLEANQFTGSIPTELASLPNLEVLNLTYNPLQGSIPPGLLRISSLKSLTLAADRLTGPLPDPIALPNLTLLDLGVNDLTGPIPKSLVQSTKLTELRLYSNEFSGPIPAELNQLTELTLLYLYDNQLEGNLPVLANLRKLQDLRVHGNRLTGPLPSWIGQLQELTQLGVGSNAFSGELPAEFFTLSKLKGFYCPNSGLAGNLKDFGKFTALEYLNLYGSNLFRGPFPVELTGLEHLGTIDFSGIPLGGSLPPEIRLLKNLGELSLPNTNLAEVPDELGELTQLGRLNLGQNQLTKIPSSIQKLTNLQVLVLNSNQIGGQLNGEIFAPLTKLSYLSISANALEGQIPASLFTLPKLEQLYIEGNKFTGAMPSVGGATKLGILNAADNRLTALPVDLAVRTNLTDLILDENEFSGPVPASVGELTKLVTLKLGNNHFSGPIPDLSKLTSARDLWLDSNQFSGSIPDWLGSLQSLRNVLLSNNKLSGKIPSSITGLTNLSSNGIQVGYNALTTNDPAVKALLDAKEPGWDLTQTVPPSDARVVAQREHSITLAWTPIGFSNGPGGYLISAASSPAGPFNVLTTTPSKQISTFIVDGLDRSTNYYFALTTVSYPNGEQQNVVVSDIGPPIAASTTTGTPAPASVVVLVYPSEIRQRPDSSGAAEYFVQNVGDLPANITLSQKENFFTQDPPSFTLPGGETQRITLTGKLQPVGAYAGESLLAGDGVPPGLTVSVRMLVTEPPSGTVTALPSTNRIDVAAHLTDSASGTVDFTNIGNATLQGIAISNVAWIIPPKDLILIPAGETRTVAFAVDQSKRPDASSPAGAVTGTLSLAYESRVAGKHESPNDNPPSVSLTTPVTVVYTITPPVDSLTVPPLGNGEIALFAAGVGYVTGQKNRTFISDMSIVNAFGVESPTDIKMFYTPADVSQGSKVTQVQSLQPNQGVTFGNVVKSVFEQSNQQGTLQIRTRSLDQLFVNANIFNVSDTNGTFGASLPIFRSDRALRAGESVFLTGLRRDAARSTYTNLFVQETSGSTGSYEIEFFDPAGNSAGDKRSGQVAPFHMASINDAVPVGAVAARVTNAAGSTGRIVSFATPIDNISGDFWAVADWNHELNAPLDEPVVIPVAGSIPGTGAFFRTDVAVTNRSGSASDGILTYYDRTGPTRERDVALAVRESLILEDIIGQSFPDLGSSLGYLEFKPHGGAFSLTSRTFATVPGLQGTYGTAVPALPRSAALRLGQSKIIAGLDVASLKTIGEAKPGTFRTNIGLVEIAGQSATVEVTVIYADIKQLVAGIRLTTLKYDLGPHQSIIDGLAAKIRQSNPNVSDLRSVQLKFKVTQGDGAVIVYTSSIDNGTADQVLRTE